MASLALRAPWCRVAMSARCQLADGQARSVVSGAVDPQAGGKPLRGFAQLRIMRIQVSGRVGGHHIMVDNQRHGTPPSGGLTKLCPSYCNPCATKFLVFNLRELYKKNDTGKIFPGMYAAILTRCTAVVRSGRAWARVCISELLQQAMTPVFWLPEPVKTAGRCMVAPGPFDRFLC